MTGTSAPHGVRTLAHERRAARLARDWATADRLKSEIEAAGWRVVDRGVDFALEPAIPPDREVDGVVLHGAPEAVPSLLDAAARPGVTLCTLGGAPVGAAGGAAGGASMSWPAERPRVIVVAGSDPVDDATGEILRLAPDALIGALLDAAVRRIPTEWVVVAPGGADGPGPATLIDACERFGTDPAVVAIGLVGARTADLHAFVPVDDGEADVLLAGPIAVRRADLVALLPFERRIVSTDRFFEWLSLALRRDTVPEEDGPRRLVVAPGADPDVVARRCAEASDDHAAKRDFYRILDRFGLDPALLSGR